MSEPTYTLKEAQRELDRRQCAFHGHDWDLVAVAGSGLPVKITCGRCGFAGAVVFPCSTPRCIANEGHVGGHVLADYNPRTRESTPPPSDEDDGVEGASGV